MSSSVESAFEDYMKAFETLDVDRILAFYDDQVALVSRAGVVAMPDGKSVRQTLAPLVEQLRSQNYRRTELRNRTIEMLSPDIAQVSGLAVRFDMDGKELGRFGVVYTMRNDDGTWKISVIVLHDAA